MPSRWEVALAGPGDAAIPLAAPLAIVSGWLDDPPRGGVGAGSVPGSRSGHGDQARRWAFGPLRTSGPGDSGGAITVLQVRLLDDGLRDRLEAAVRPGAMIRLGEHQFQITEPPRELDQVPWRRLRQGSGRRAWQLRFVTPACLRRGNRTSPWPAPESVARSLAERWHRLDPATAPPLPAPGAGPVWVSDLDGRSDVHVLTRRVRKDGRWRFEDEMISGFIGRLRYVCDKGTDEEAAAFDALMEFAVYAGVGSHTTCGFGVVVPEPSWQPPTVRSAGGC